MELLTKNFKLIGGALILICCLLPFASVGGWVSMSGFNFFSGNFLTLLSILLIVAGAAALIFVNLTKEIELAPKFTLSCIAKLAVLGGSVLALIAVLSTPFLSIGFGLILVVIFALAVFFEEKILAAIKK
ncbi:MAG: hypothetical protein FWH23_03730 [Bacteroidales bacterium]|nr:hypothetical protein [Bacteroidales bacterium]MCL2133653.1 hypothetical protein [Bacteroidales bacterium]